MQRQPIIGGHHNRRMFSSTADKEASIFDSADFFEEEEVPDTSEVF